MVSTSHTIRAAAIHSELKDQTEPDGGDQPGFQLDRTITDRTDSQWETVRSDDSQRYSSSL
jgi:hypothetical protein